MQKKIYKEDNGVNFGNWKDDVSEFLYKKSTKEILSLISVPQVVADYGGANGNLKQFIPQAVSIDKDPSKEPDIIDNILTHKNEYDLVVIRYVLHYLTDKEVLQLFKSIQSKKTLVIQFVNNDLESKYHNSQNEEQKYFRTEEQLKALLPKTAEKIYASKSYTLGALFYENRLGKGVYKNHQESISAYLI